MADKDQPAQAPKGGSFPPPPPGPPSGPSAGQNGLNSHPIPQYIPDSHSDLYDSPSAAAGQHAQHTQQTPHQPPPPDSDGAPKKVGWAQRFSGFGTKAAAPFNMLANKLGAETFLPSTMDKEIAKAERILKNFCKDGIYTDNSAPETVEAPTTDANGKPTTVAAKPKKNRTLLTIPSKVINRAVGLAIFTTARAGFHVSGATGSGVIIARLPDGSWSPPSGIQVHSVGAGFVIGIDIYDCVVVINTREALEAFTKTRMSLGSDLAVVAGPWGAGGSVDFAAPTGAKGNKEEKGKGKDEANTGSQPAEAVKEPDGNPNTPTPADREAKAGEGKVPTVNEPVTDKANGEDANNTAERPQAAKERKPSAFKQVMKQPTYSYVKSRGFYAGVQIDGTVVTERKDANAAFYGETVSVQQILKGELSLVPGKQSWATTVQPLFDTIKGAEGWRAQSPGEQEWANQMGVDPNSTYGHGNAPQGYPDPVFENPPPKPPRHTDGNVDAATQGVAAMNLGSSSSAAGPSTGPPPDTSTATPTASAKSAEAAAEFERNRQREELERRELEEEIARNRQSEAASMVTAPPGYSEMARPGEASHGDATGVNSADLPPAYGGSGANNPVDSKSGHN